MASWEDVSRIALAQTCEQVKRETRRWLIKDKLFVWERPLRPKEIEALASAIHDGPILGAHVEHLGAKQALLVEDPRVFFTTPHFEGSGYRQPRHTGTTRIAKRSSRRSRRSAIASLPNDWPRHTPPRQPTSS